MESAARTALPVGASQVNEQMNQVEHFISTIEETLNELNKKLEPVLRHLQPPAPTDQGAKVPIAVESLCPLADRLATLRHRLKDANKHAESMVGRIEL